MRTYEVVTACYVPVGPGWKWKKPGQQVKLDTADARDLGDLVAPVGGAAPKRKATPKVSSPSESGGAQKLRTPETKADTPEVEKDSSDLVKPDRIKSDPLKEVGSDGSESPPAVQ